MEDNYLLISGQLIPYQPRIVGKKYSILRFYAATVALCVEYLHDKNIVFRDMKPENLLIGNDGYLRLTDFGFAKILNEGRTFTVCGTP